MVCKVIGSGRGPRARGPTWPTDILRARSAPQVPVVARANHTTCLKLLIHAADLSNPTKTWATYDRWTAKIMEEFYAQADREAELDLPRTVPPRGQCEMDKFQLGFIGFIRPLLSLIHI